MSRTNGVSVLQGEIGIHVLRYRDIRMIGHMWGRNKKTSNLFSVGACE